MTKHISVHTLKKRASPKTSALGHRIKWGEILTRCASETAIRRWQGSCKQCGYAVTLTDRPNPGESYISGLAVGYPCYPAGPEMPLNKAARDLAEAANRIAMQATAPTVTQRADLKLFVARVFTIIDPKGGKR